MKKKLMDLLNKKNLRKQEINSKVDSTEDVAELRGLNEELTALNAEIRDIEGMIAALPDEAGDEGSANERTAAVNGQIPGVVSAGATPEARKAPDEDGLEYRKAFMNYVLNNVPIPTELRADENTLTTDVGSMIHPVVVNRIIEEMETIGMILPLVNQTSYKTGVKIPTSSIKPVATWVGEGQGSDKQKKGTAYIEFSAHKLRCEISMSMEVGVMSLAIFEKKFVEQVSEAMNKKLESTIVSNADGSTSPKGILAETPKSGQALQWVEPTYENIVAAEAAIPQAYEGKAKWCMSKQSFMACIGITDANNQPIARVNYGLGKKPERYLLGREVVLSGDYLPNYTASLAANTIFAFIFDFSAYTLNKVYDMGIQKKQDWDTEDLLTKAVRSYDGKVTDKGSLVTIKKKSA